MLLIYFSVIVLVYLNIFFARLSLSKPPPIMLDQLREEHQGGPRLKYQLFSELRMATNILDEWTP